MAVTATLLAAGSGLAAAAVTDGSVTIVEDGAVLDGDQVNGYVHIKANNVRIRNVTIRYDGNYALRVFDGFSGTGHRGHSDHLHRRQDEWRGIRELPGRPGER